MPKKRSYHKPSKQIDIAKRRINFLFRAAKDDFKHNSKEADRLMKLALRVATKNKIRLNSAQKKTVCKNCHAYLVPGANCRVRLHKHRLIYYCMKCRHFMRHPIK